MVINIKLNKNKSMILLVLLIFIVGCKEVSNDNETISVSKMIGKGKAEIAGNSYDMHLDIELDFEDLDEPYFKEEAGIEC